MTRNIIISLVVAVIATWLTDLGELSDSTDYYSYITSAYKHTPNSNRPADESKHHTPEVIQLQSATIHLPFFLRRYKLKSNGSTLSETVQKKISSSGILTFTFCFITQLKTYRWNVPKYIYLRNLRI